MISKNERENKVEELIRRLTALTPSQEACEQRKAIREVNGEGSCGFSAEITKDEGKGIGRSLRTHAPKRMENSQKAEMSG